MQQEELDKLLSMIFADESIPEQIQQEAERNLAVLIFQLSSDREKAMDNLKTYTFWHPEDGSILQIGLSEEEKNSFNANEVAPTFVNSEFLVASSNTVTNSFPLNEAFLIA